jgi:putative transposase
VRIFNTDSDYKHFEALLQEAKDLTGMRVLAYCVMPNHFHLVLHPRTDDDMGAFMGWLTTTHVRQYRTRTETIGQGHLYQGRYKSFPVETDIHALMVVRYVEQNPLRAKLTTRAEDWQWSSLWRREKGTIKEKALLDPLPIHLPENYLDEVNDVPGEEVLETIRCSVNKGKPYGTLQWVEGVIQQFNLGHTLRGPGRPKGS